MEVFVEPMLQWHTAFFAGIRIELFPIQMIVAFRLSKEQNFWLKNLIDDLANREVVEGLAKAYHEHRENTLYHSLMNVIIKENEELFKEETGVCEAIIDLFRDEYDKGIEKATQVGLEKDRLEAIQKMLKRK